MPDNVRDPFELIGTTIDGKYRVASVIGDGGFGVVYRGVHTGFGELIAIKCLKIPSNLDEKHREELLEGLREEGRLLHKLSRATSGIVQALDVGSMTTPAGVWVPFLVLEWLDGETIGELQKRREDEGLGGMPVNEAVELLTPAARALAVAHQHKIAHRDVKPANLFVTKVGDKRTVKVLDFGIAKVLTDTTITEALALTQQGPSAFTPRYGAPEQFNKQRGATGPWTDVFALALILVELTTGKRALDGDDPTQLYVASADPTLRPTLRGRGLDVSDAVENVIAKALHVEPKYRYPEAGEFWDALAQATGVTGEAGRTSSPAVSSGRGKASDSGKQKPIDSSMDTAVYAAQASISVESEGRPSGPPEPHAVTKPIESLQKGDAPPVVISSKDAAAPDITSASAHVAAAAKEPTARSGSAARSRPDDPMAETPLFARLPSAVAAEAAKGTSAKAGAAKDTAAAAPTKVSAGGDLKTTTPSTRDAPMSAPASSQGPQSSGRGLLIALGVIGAGAALTAYLYFTGPGASIDPSGPRGSASTAASGKPTGTLKPTSGPTASASSTATASAAADAGASTDAGAPPAPPEDMIYIAPMTAKLGEGPTLREVILTRGFYIEKREVTARAYHACVEAGTCSAATEPKVIARFTGAPDPDAGTDPDAGPNEAVKQAEDMWRSRCTEKSAELGNHPINCLTYTQAEQYCRSRKRRLPTEAEWEAAAQGADGRAYPWGNKRPSCETACVDKNSECRGGDVATCAAGAHADDKTPSEIFDLGGNVAEWVVDGFAAKPPAGTDPRANPWAKTRVVRGGSFFDDLDMLRSATRREVPPGAAEAWIGVRCAMDVPTSP